MPRRGGQAHVATIKTKGKGGKEYTSYLLRRSYREGGKARHENLGNLSHLPLPMIDAISARCLPAGCWSTSTSKSPDRVLAPARARRGGARRAALARSGAAAPDRASAARRPPRRARAGARTRSGDCCVEVDQHPAARSSCGSRRSSGSAGARGSRGSRAEPCHLPVGAAQQVGRVLLPALALRLDCGYVSLTATARHSRRITTLSDRIKAQLWLHTTTKKKSDPRKHGPSALRPSKTSD